MNGLEVLAMDCAKYSRLPETLHERGLSAALCNWNVRIGKVVLG
jgi:hypothetical protein